MVNEYYLLAGVTAIGCWVDWGIWRMSDIRKLRGNLYFLPLLTQVLHIASDTQFYVVLS